MIGTKMNSNWIAALSQVSSQRSLYAVLDFSFNRMRSGAHSRILSFFRPLPSTKISFRPLATKLLLPRRVYLQCPHFWPTERACFYPPYRYCEQALLTVPLVVAASGGSRSLLFIRPAFYILAIRICCCRYQILKRSNKM